ncbi:MAG TPA: DUF1266 domain-containing protein [Candidatus Flavonifractor merdigallinarum]|uniref:DUF1266 domain-containing protein n=1 Tax=Candidatus Flavonifractor merdigallinarum TaxID=2838589 RepID=A0A9D1YBM6_9FIRM|nr:DUF1266 domain-containing protein [Candidatus Flavonifractor merdigallinarum]
METFFILLEILSPLLWAIGLGLAVGLTLRALILHIQRPREARGNPRPCLSPTLQWMNTAGAILLAANRGQFRLMAGCIYPGLEWRHVNSTQKMLLEWWDIRDHSSALHEMNDVLHIGTHARYRAEMEELSARYGNASEMELIEIAKQTNPKADEDSFLPRMLLAYRRYGENALLGWDVGRVCYIMQCCYVAGYVSMEEVLDLGVEAGRKAQAFFHNWEEMMESYLLGGQYWKREDAGDRNSMTAKRFRLYERLWKGKRPYKSIPFSTVPFDTPLSKEVLTDQYGILPEFQKEFESAVQWGYRQRDKQKQSPRGGTVE